MWEWLELLGSVEEDSLLTALEWKAGITGVLQFAGPLCTTVSYSTKFPNTLRNIPAGEPHVYNYMCPEILT